LTGAISMAIKKMTAINPHGPDVSIVLLTYNGDAYLDEVLESIFAQKTRFSYEVIAIDSGSSDRTLAILKDHPVTLVEISNHEFGHGRTRNLGAHYACGQYVVFLTQDATPANEYWLENLVRPVAEYSRIAGAYSRQIPRPDCNPWEARDIGIGAGPISCLKRVEFQDRIQTESYHANQSKFIAFSNVSSCIRKSVLQVLGFSEHIAMVEDQEWCKRAIEASYTVAYESASVVRHSHNHSLKMIYKRHFDYGVSMREFAPVPMTLGSVLIYTALQTLGDIVFILRQRRHEVAVLKWMMQSPLVRFAMRWGLYQGLKTSAEGAPVEKMVGGWTARQLPPKNPPAARPYADAEAARK
jgi:rhamnosyltransferase